MSAAEKFQSVSLSEKIAAICVLERPKRQLFERMRLFVLRKEERGKDKLLISSLLSLTIRKEVIALLWVQKCLKRPQQAHQQRETSLWCFVGGRLDVDRRHQGAGFCFHVDDVCPFTAPMFHARSAIFCRCQFFPLFCCILHRCFGPWRTLTTRIFPSLRSRISSTKRPYNGSLWVGKEESVKRQRAVA